MKGRKKKGRRRKEEGSGERELRENAEMGKKNCPMIGTVVFGFKKKKKTVFFFFFFLFLLTKSIISKGCRFLFVFGEKKKKIQSNKNSKHFL